LPKAFHGRTSHQGHLQTYPNGVEVLKGINIEIDDGQFLIFVGSSGCGKSDAAST